MAPETPTLARKLPPGLSLTARRDLWFVQPLLTFLVLTGFVVYATARVFENRHFIADNGAYHYATPFGNPDFTPFVPPFLLDIPLVGQYVGYPAVLILPFVAGFRLTCYYYRKAYYRGFGLDPAACAVKDLHSRRYRGESRFPFTLQNLHRYFLYAALVVLVFNFWDAGHAVLTPHGPYFGLGNLIMLLNVVLLTAYTLGCHSFRHLVGGQLDCFTCDAPSRLRHSLWGRITILNQRHQLWAWTSLFWVAFTDWYIRYVAMTGVATVLGVPA